MTNSADSTTIVRGDFQHQQIPIEGVSLHVVTAGSADKPAVLFLHGFPENWQVFEKVMSSFKESGLVNVQGQLILGSGHYAPEEAPDQVIKVLKAFLQ